MKRFQVQGEMVDLGTYEAEDEQGALDAMAIDAGYNDYADLLARVPDSEREDVTLREVDATLVSYRNDIYTIVGSDEVWDEDVRPNVDSARKLYDLLGWGAFTEVWEIELDGATQLYFRVR